MNTKRTYHINIGFLIIVISVFISLLLTVFALDELFINLTEHNVIRQNPLDTFEVIEHDTAQKISLDHIQKTERMTEIFDKSFFTIKR